MSAGGLSATLAMSERCRELRDVGREVYALGFGQSPFPVFPSMARELASRTHEKDYLPVAGLPELREAVSAWAARTRRVSVDAEQVLIGPGTKELMYLLQLAHGGDLVVPTPCWVSYAPQAEMLGHRVVTVPTAAGDDFALAPETLDRACEASGVRGGILVLNSPSNPTGTAYSRGELEALAEVARARELVVLADEIYSGLHFEGEHVSMARFYPEGTVITDGISKWAGAGGWRLGVMIFPPGLAGLRDAVAAAASQTYSSVSAPIQYAAIPAFADSLELAGTLRRAREMLGSLLRRTASRLRDAGAVVAEPEGAYYLFPELSRWAPRLQARGIASSAELCERLLEDTGVALLPGVEFRRPPAEPCARIACVDFDGAAALEAMPDDGAGAGPDFLERHCGRVLRGIDVMLEWLGEPD